MVIRCALRQNKDIVEGRYDIGEIIRIERKNDEHTISDKTFDFSYGKLYACFQAVMKIL